MVFTYQRLFLLPRSAEWVLLVRKHQQGDTFQLFLLQHQSQLLLGVANAIWVRRIHHLTRDGWEMMGE